MQWLKNGFVTKRPVEVTKEHLDLAENLLISQAQSTLKKETVNSLLPEVVTVKGVARENHEIILVGGRERNRFRVGYDSPGVPVSPLVPVVSIVLS